MKYYLSYVEFKQGASNHSALMLSSQKDDDSEPEISYQVGFNKGGDMLINESSKITEKYQGALVEEDIASKALYSSRTVKHKTFELSEDEATRFFLIVNEDKRKYEHKGVDDYQLVTHNCKTYAMNMFEKLGVSEASLLTNKTIQRPGTRNNFLENIEKQNIRCPEKEQFLSDLGSLNTMYQELKGTLNIASFNVDVLNLDQNKLELVQLLNENEFLSDKSKDAIDNMASCIQSIEYSLSNSSKNPHKAGFDSGLSMAISDIKSKAEELNNIISTDPIGKFNNKSQALDESLDKLNKGYNDKSIKFVWNKPLVTAKRKNLQTPKESEREAARSPPQPSAGHDAAVAPSSPKAPPIDYESTEAPLPPERPQIDVDVPKLSDSSKESPTWEVSKDEWKKAKQYFKENPDEGKLDKKGKVEGLNSYFIKTDENKIYAVAPGKAFAAGGVGKIKLCQDESGHKVAVKVEGVQKAYVKNLNSEYEKLINVGQSKGRAIAKHEGRFDPNIQKSKMNDGDGKSIDTKVFTVIDLFKGGDLKGALKGIDNKKWLENEKVTKKLDLAITALGTIQELHEKRNMLHRDIKAENFMLEKPPGHGSSKIHPIDFGYAQYMNEEGIVIDKKGAGSPGYIAPETEQLGSKTFSTASEMYALGQMLEVDFGLSDTKGIHEFILDRTQEIVETDFKDLEDNLIHSGKSEQVRETIENKQIEMLANALFVGQDEEQKINFDDLDGKIQEQLKAILNTRNAQWVVDGFKMAIEELENDNPEIKSDNKGNSVNVLDLVQKIKEDNSSLYEKINQKGICVDLIDKMKSDDPDNRPSIKDVVKDLKRLKKEMAPPKEGLLLRIKRKINNVIAKISPKSVIDEYNALVVEQAQAQAVAGERERALLGKLNELAEGGEEYKQTVSGSDQNTLEASVIPPEEKTVIFMAEHRKNELGSEAKPDEGEAELASNKSFKP